jgi:hypothetical protein
LDILLKSIGFQFTFSSRVSIFDFKILVHVLLMCLTIFFYVGSPTGQKYYVILVVLVDDIDVLPATVAGITLITVSNAVTPFNVYIC